MSRATLLAPPPPANSEAWEAWRRSGIGASEIPVILGMDPWTTERGLALEKRGLVERAKPTTAMGWGHRIEALGASLYSERTGRELVETGTLVDPARPHVYATPDRAVVGERRLVELKWTNRWSEPPRRVVVQAQAQMGVADADVVDVVVMGPYGEPTFHEIERVETDVVALLDFAEEWYARFVLGDELPDEDGSEQSRRYLATLGGTGRMDATDEQTRLMAALRRARQDVAAAEAERDRLAGLLMASMAGMERVDGLGWHVTWKQAKGATRTDWKSVAAAYRALLEDPILSGIRAVTESPDLDALVSIHTNTGEPTRPFKPHWDEEEV